MASFQWHASPSAANLQRTPGSSSSHYIIATGAQQESADAVSRTLYQLLFTESKALRAHVGDCFDLVTMGEKHLDEHGLVLFTSYLARRIGVPPSAFGDVYDQFMRFDFDGNGTLEPHETYKLAKAQLLRYWRRELGHRIEVPVPSKSVEEAGYTVVRKLGEGGQGTVTLVQDRKKEHFCIKSYRKDSQNAGGLSDLQEEFMKMKYLKNEHIAATHEIFQDATCYYVVNEPYFGGDLSEIKGKAKRKGIPMTKEWWRGIFQQCISALAWMHEQAIMHCDIKEQNIMLKSEELQRPQVVIIDLGLARTSTAGDGGVAGTPGYIPPETWQTGKWYPRGDIFSMGVAMMQLLTDRYVFTEGCKSIEEVSQATQTWHPPYHDMPQDYDDMSMLLMKMLQKDLKRRLKAPQVLDEPFFQEYGEVGAFLTSFCACRSR